MKIFSNFDTKLKQKELEKYKKEFGPDKVLLIGKSRLFKFMKVIFPFMGVLLFSVGFLFLLHYGLGKQAVIYAGFPIVGIVIVFSLVPILKNFIDYHMDFMVINPRLFIKYNQEGLFKRDYTTTYVVDIKSVIVRKKGLFYSIFDVGDVIFLSEGDQERTDLSLSYVSDPEKEKSKIITIKNYGEQMFFKSI